MSRKMDDRLISSGDLGEIVRMAALDLAGSDLLANFPELLTMFLCLVKFY